MAHNQQGGQQGGYPQQGGQGGFGGQQGGFGGQPQHGGQQGGYGGQQGGYPQQGGQGGFGGQQGGFGGQPQQGGFGGQPQHGGQQGGYPQQGGQGGFGGQQGGYGGQSQQPFQPPQQHGQNWGQTFYNSIQDAEMLQLHGWFNSVDKDHSGSITANELSTMKWIGDITLGLPTCEQLVKIFDYDRSGTLGFQEYAQLYKYVATMQGAFAQCDKDRSGTLEINEVAQALGTSGYNFSVQTVQQVLNKFGKKEFNQAHAKIDFEAYMKLCAFLGQVKSSFELYDQGHTGMVHLTLEQLTYIGSGF